MAVISVEPEAFCFIDIGSGKGRALFLAEQYGFQRIIGVELSKKVHQVAEDNLNRYRAAVRRDPRIELCNCDALELDLPNAPTVVFMFNPFDSVIMSQFAAKIDESLAKNLREFYLIYVHPFAEDALKRGLHLRKIFEERRKDNFVVYGIKQKGAE
jgi:predicted RNA methylase